MNTPPPLTAHTLREAFTAGNALVRHHFWRYGLQGAFLFLLMGSASALTAIFHHGRPVQPGPLSQFAISTLTGLFSVGLYRSLWDGLSGEAIRFRRLFWGFGKPAAWALAIIPALLSIPTALLVPLRQGHLDASPWVAVPLFAIVILVGLVVGYAFALTARLDAPPALSSLRLALGIFRRGRRRWIALPFLLGLAIMGAALVLMLVFVAMLFLSVHLHVSKAAIGLLALLVMAPLVIVLFMMLFPWMGGATVAAAGSLESEAE